MTPNYKIILLRKKKKLNHPLGVVRWYNNSQTQKSKSHTFNFEY